MPRTLVLYTRAGCHLCHVMQAQAEPLLQGAGAQLELVDIDGDAALKERYDWRVPVLAAGDRIICEGHLDEAELLDFLETGA